MNGKGSKPRPMSIDRDEWAERWERIRWGSEHPDWPERGDPCDNCGIDPGKYTGSFWWLCDKCAGLDKYTDVAPDPETP